MIFRKNRVMHAPNFIIDVLDWCSPFPIVIAPLLVGRTVDNILYVAAPRDDHCRKIAILLLYGFFGIHQFWLLRHFVTRE